MPNRRDDLAQPGRHAGHSARRGPDVEALGHLVEQHVDRDQLGAGGGIDSPPAGFDEEVQQMVLAGGGVGEHEPAGAEGRELALDGERGEHGADRRVERVATFSQHLRSGLRGQRVPSRDHTSSWHGMARLTLPALGLPAGNELRHFEVESEVRVLGAPDARLSLRLLKLPTAGAARRAVSVAGGDDRHPALLVDLVVDHRAEDDVGARVSSLGDGPGRLVDLPQREVATAR